MRWNRGARAWPVVVALAALAGGAPGWAQTAGTAEERPDERRIRFDVPAQPLASALNAFGRQAGLQVSVDAAAAAAAEARAVRGTYTVDEALARLLAGTGIAWRFSGDRTVVLSRAAPESGALHLDPVTVEARHGVAETATGPVEGYLAHRSLTATKTDTPVLELPASVQVVPRDVIEDQGALSLKDVYENVSGVAQAGNTLNAQTEVLPIVRGFESPTLLRNGLRSTQVGAVDLVNVERVEVLKGPASILYGALEPGGTVNLVTKRPLPTARHELEQQVGSEAFLRTTADSTGPLAADGSLLYRLNLAYTNADSFRDDIELRRTAVAPSLLWLPTDRTELLLDASYVRETQPYDSGIPLDADGNPLADESTFFGDPDLDGRTIEDYAASYQFTYEVDPVWTLRNQLQLHRARAENESLRPRGVGEAGGRTMLALRYQNEDRQDDEAQFVLDATAKFATGAVDHTLLLGAELLAQDSDFRRYRQNVPAVVVSDDPDVHFDPPADQPREAILGTTRWAGLYVQDQLSLLDGGRLKLLVGGRYDVVRQESETDGVAAPDVRDQAFSGRAGLLYRVTPQHSAYASVSQSFQPQAPGTLDAGGAALDPETGVQYEAGVKSAFFDERLLATASVFRIEKTNVAVLDRPLFNATGQLAYFPGVEERSQGVEFDLTGALTDRLSVVATYSYTDTEVLENADDPAMVGQPLGGVPKHKARLWLTYRFGEGSGLDGFGVGGGVRYVGASTAQFDTDVRLDPYAVVDAAAWYDWETLRLGVNVYNLLGRDYVARASDRAIAHPGQPLTVVGSLTVRF
ncbi:TonB-dependent siderophore receptor [Azospirillum sp. ST 5-10]|uniref:TonB-dependent siderophore receptor n=1 Tax=unclassified Azospirillum TaxID=2630922 RepID=UPI003F49CA67